MWALVIYLFGRGKYENKPVFWAGSLIVVAATLVVNMVSSPEKIAVMTLTILATFMVATYSYLKQGRVNGLLELLLAGPTVSWEYVRSGWAILSAIFAGTLAKVMRLDVGHKERSPWLKSVVVGVLVGLPLVAWLISTLTSADPIFEAWVSSIVSGELISQLPARLILSLVSVCVLLPMLLMQWRGYRSPLSFLTRVRFGREMMVVLSLVVVVLAAFLVVQWPYVFATVAQETDLSKFGVATYSEYVQRGFADLLKVAAMVFGVSWIAFLLNKSQSGKEQKLLMMMQGILGLEFVVFIISIFRRVWLYQMYHGLTLARIYGLALLVLILGMMTTLALRYFYRSISWVTFEAMWILLVVFSLVLLRAERLVILDPPTVNGRVDYVYLARLSADGKEGWLESYNYVKGVVTTLENKPGIINKDERRDAYYSVLITHQLVNNYQDVDQRKRESLGMWEMLLTFSPHKKAVSQWMEREIGETNLLELQDRVQALQNRIRSQPESEQGYEIDISMQSPFLR
jgi:hypothetical protein